MLTSAVIPTPTIVDESSTDSSDFTSSETSTSVSTTELSPTEPSGFIQSPPDAGAANAGRWIEGTLVGMAVMCGALMVFL